MKRNGTSYEGDISDRGQELSSAGLYGAPLQSILSRTEPVLAILSKITMVCNLVDQFGLLALGLVGWSADHLADSLADY